MPGAETFLASSDAYDRHVGRYGPQLAEALIEFAGIEPGMRALDVGCRPGALAAALAERLGPANVSAADPSVPFARAARARLPGVEVLVAGAEKLPLPDDSFDAVLSQLVVNFMSDPKAGVREMARVTSPGGVTASCVWDYACETTLLRAFWDAAREIVPEAAAASDEGVVMRWCGEGELADLWTAAGVADVRSGALVVRASYTSFDDLWSPFPQGSLPRARSAKRSARRIEPRCAARISDASESATARSRSQRGPGPPPGPRPRRRSPASFPRQASLSLGRCTS